MLVKKGGQQERDKESRLLDYKSAMSYLSLSYSSVRTLVLNGQIPHVKYGRRVLIDVRDLDKWIEQNKEVGV